MDASILPRTYGKEQVNTMIKQLKQDDHNVIEEVIVTQHEDDRTITGRAVTAGLPSQEKRMNHIGSRLPLNDGPPWGGP